MGLNDTGRNTMLGGLTPTHVSLHTGDPGSTGTNEQALTGSPAYARKTITWAAAASGQRKNSAVITFDVPAGTYSYIGLWSAVTAGTFYGFLPIGPYVAGAGAVVASTDTVTSHAHGLANDQRLYVRNILAEAVPTGLVEGTLYFIVNATADSFQLATTQGGTPVDITANGEIFFQRVTPEVFIGQGQISLAINALVLDATLI